MQLKEQTDTCKLHGIKCYNISARGIRDIKYCKELKKLAVLRSDYSVEIWNFAHSPFLERTIPGSYEETIDVLCWAGNRLFTVGFSGHGLKEWDLKTLKPKRRLLLTGEKGICMDYHEGTQKIAVGTEEGIINIFDTSSEDLQFSKVFDRQDHRVNCCKFNEAGDKLVSGTIGSVKVWSVETGHVIHRMSLGRIDSQSDTIVWCIELIDAAAFTIITGDSRGRVTFWDGNLGSQINYVHASNVDIMCLSVAEDRKSFFCSGVEQVLKKYSKVKISRSGSEVEQWVRCAKKSSIHTHDVHAMTTIGDEQLISGGVDGFLSFASQDLKQFERAGPFLSRPFIILAEEARLILMKYVNYIEVWKLASAGDLETEESENLEDEGLFSGEDEMKPPPKLKSKENPKYCLKDLPEKLLELRTKNDEMVTSCSISNDGQWIAYSTASSFRIFRFIVQNGSKPSLQLIKAMPTELKPCSSLIFSKDSSQLITVRNDGRCSVFDVDTEIIHKETFDISEHHSDSVHLMETSNCSTYLVLASLCNGISVWNLRRNKWCHSKTLPKYACPATSLQIRNDQPVLVVSYSDNKILEFNLEGNFIQFTAILPADSSKVTDVISSISLDPRNRDAIIFVRNNSINVLTKNAEKASSKKAKLAASAGTSFDVKVTKSYNTKLIHLAFFGENEMAAFEMNPVTLTENLPPPLRKKVFGKT